MSNAPIVSPLHPLPPLPSLEEKHLRFEKFSASGLETVDVLRPASAPYANADPQAPALLLVPGLGMNCRNYIRQLPLGALCDLHLLQAVNAPVAGEAGLGHFARHVEEYILQRGLDQRPGGMILGGCSMGGAVSLHVCSRGRVKPRALLLLGSFAHCKHLPYYQRLLAPLSYVLPLNAAKRCLKMLLSTFGDKFGGARGAGMRWMTSGKLHRTHGYFGRAIMALTRQNQLEPARKLSIPALVLHGARDWVLPPAAGIEMAETIPNARFKLIDQAGHALIFTHAELVNAEIAAFLRDVCAQKPMLR